MRVLRADQNQHVGALITCHVSLLTCRSGLPSRGPHGHPRPEEQWAGQIRCPRQLGYHTALVLIPSQGCENALHFFLTNKKEVECSLALEIKIITAAAQSRACSASCFGIYGRSRLGISIGDDELFNIIIIIFKEAFAMVSLKSRLAFCLIPSVSIYGNVQGS